MSTVIRSSASRVFSLAAPIVMVAVLQAGGCLRSTPPPPPPGGTYISFSAGASFEQSVLLEGEGVEEGSNLARFTLLGAHQPKHKPDTIYIAADGEGLVVSHTNGESWQQILTPLDSTVDVALLENGVLVATGTGPEGQGFVIRSLDDGLSWQTVLTVPVPTEEGPFRIIGRQDIVGSILLTIESDPFDGNRLYAGSNLGGVLVGEQSAKVWHTIHTLTPGRFDPSQNGGRVSIEKLIPSPHVRGELLAVTTENKLWRVRAGQQTEIPIPVEQSPEGKKFFISKGDYDVFDVAFALGNPKLLLAGVTNAAVVSQDAGVTWQELAVPIEAVIQFNSIRVAVSPTNSNRFLIAINNVVYRSEDAGTTWNTFSLGLPAHKVVSLLINPVNASHVAAVVAPLDT